MDERVEQIVSQVLAEMGVELVELQIRHGKCSTVRVFVWEEGGISLDRCTAVSRRLSEALDREDPIEGRYFLEVSSPGTDRPLRSRRDFERQIGPEAEFHHVEAPAPHELEIAPEARLVELRIVRRGILAPVEDPAHGEGRAVEEDRILLQIGDDLRPVPLDRIKSAKVKAVW